MKKRRLLAALLTVVMLVAMVPQVFAAGNEQSPYATRGQVVEMLLSAADDYNSGVKKTDIIQGNGDGNLRENETVTRAEAMIMLRRAFGQLPTPMGDALRTGFVGVTFDDVPQWAAEDISALTAAGILAGTGDNKLRPLDKVTVEQMELMIRRVWALEASNLKDDFYATVNRQWLANSVIPNGEVSGGAMMEMNAKNNAQAAEIIKSVAAATHEKGSKEQKIADFYNGVMAVKKGQVNDLSPLKPYFDKINAAKTMDDLMEVRGTLLNDLGMSSLCAFSIAVDLKDSDKYALTFQGMGADLPKDYFEAGGQVMDAYKGVLKSLLLLTGDDVEQADKNTQLIYELEKDLAYAAMSVEDSNNIDKIYNLYTMAELQEMIPAIDLNELLKQDGLRLEDKIGVTDPGLLKASAAYYIDEKVDVMKALMKLSLIQSYGPALSEDVNKINTAFQQSFYGIEGEKGAEETATLMTQQVMGDYVGQLYVQKHFSAEAKQDVTNMVKQFIEVYKQRLQKLDWMSDKTKQKAIKKLDTMDMKIGYPDKWDDSMDNVEITGSYYQNMINIMKATRKQLAEHQGTKVDKSGWMMTVYTVNAYYSASANEIVFPAGILQAPFYDKDASLEENLGGIGFVIAHEITHSFDNNGAKFDENGNAADWWEPADYEHFQKLCSEVEEFYTGPEVAPGIANNGTRTLSENIADLGSMACVLETAKKEANPDYKALFENLAQCWTMTSGRDYLQMLSSMDVHSFNKVRTNRTLQNYEEFYQAYGIQPGDGMYVAPEDRVSIW